jgi:hypothetical protein
MWSTVLRILVEPHSVPNALAFTAMRTTLNIDDDVLLAAKQRARTEGMPLGKVVSDLLSEALQPPESVYGLVPFPTRGHVVTNELINRLRDGDNC